MVRHLIPPSASVQDLIFASASAPVYSLWSLNLNMPSTSTSASYCSALNCFNRQCNRPDLSFFRFPVKQERCQQWVQNTRRHDLLHRTAAYLSHNCRLCSDHFELSQFNNKQTKNRLVWDAVPTLFDIHNPPKQLYSQRRKLERNNENLPSSPKPSKQQRGK